MDDTSGFYWVERRVARWGGIEAALMGENLAAIKVAVSVERAVAMLAAQKVGCSAVEWAVWTAWIAAV